MDGLAGEDHEAVGVEGLEDLTERGLVELDPLQILETLRGDHQLGERRGDNLGREAVGEEPILVESDRGG